MQKTRRTLATPFGIPAHLLPWAVWGLAALFYFYEMILQVSPGVMVPELMRAFQVNAAALGNLAAFYFYAYAGMQIPVGVLIDRYGPRRLLTAAISVCALGCLIFGSAMALPYAEAGRFLIGLGSAFAAVGCMKLAASWFPVERFGLLTGMMVTVGMSGAVFGETPLALLVGKIDWRPSMILLGCIGIALSATIWIIIRDHRQHTSASIAHAATSQPSMGQGLRAVMRSKQTWLASIYGGLMFAPTSAFGALWGVPFLMQAYALSRPAAAGIISMLFIGWVVGSPVSGWFSDYIGKRRPPMFIGSVGALLSMIAIIYVPHLPLWLMNTLLFSFGFFSSGFLPAFSIVREINSSRTSATALGFINMLNMVGGAVLQPFIGLILDLFWTGSMADGARSYSVENFHIALAVLPIAMAISLLILPFVKETYCQPADIE